MVVHQEPSTFTWLFALFYCLFLCNVFYLKSWKLKGFLLFLKEITSRWVKPMLLKEIYPPNLSVLAMLYKRDEIRFDLQLQIKKMSWNGYGYPGAYGAPYNAGFPQPGGYGPWGPTGVPGYGQGFAPGAYNPMNNGFMNGGCYRDDRWFNGGHGRMGRSRSSSDRKKRFYGGYY